MIRVSWWNGVWTELEYETVQHIKSQPSTKGVNVTTYRCGCEETAKDQWILHICLWHEGFDEGVVIGKGDEPVS